METPEGNTRIDLPGSEAIAKPPATPTKRYTALIMAGQRPGENDLVRELGAPHRSFVDIRGEPMLERVVRTLEQVESVDRILVSLDQPEILDRFPSLSARVTAGAIQLFRNETSITATVIHALEQIPSLLPS